jgi:hypothetical protein
MFQNIVFLNGNFRDSPFGGVGGIRVVVSVVSALAIAGIIPNGLGHRPAPRTS